MTLHTWLAFFTASWLISLSPGPGALSCISAGQRVGYWRGLWNIFGLQLGVVTLVGFVAVGLGTVLQASQILFMLIKWVGAGYLVWLGIQQWRSPANPVETIEDAAQERWRMLVRAYLINVSNPKGVLFMVAVLPQFIDIDAPQAAQYAICGVTLVFTDLVIMSGYTLLAARVLRTLRDPVHIRWLNRSFGSLFIGAGILLAGFRRS